MLSLATAYIILRPFFSLRPELASRVSGGADIPLEADAWVLDLDNPAFPGSTPGKTQAITPVTHPHLRIDQTVVSIPRVEPGDQVYCELSRRVRSRIHGCVQNANGASSRAHGRRSRGRSGPQRHGRLVGAVHPCGATDGTKVRHRPLSCAAQPSVPASYNGSVWMDRCCAMLTSPVTAARPICATNATRSCGASRHRE